MTNQEIFDKVATHLLTQNEKAMGPAVADDLHGAPQCKYRAEDGKKCAVGCLIPDEMYSPEIEGKGLRTWRPSTKSPLDAATDAILEGNDDGYALLVQLQCVHDSSDVALWPESLKCIGLRFNLSRPQILRDALNALNAVNG